MITVIKQPSSALLVRNDVKYVLQTDNLIINAGVKANTLLVISSLTGNTGSFTLNFMGLSVLFTAVSGTPSSTAYEFKDGGFANFTLYANHIITMLKKHYVLDDNYNITIDVVGAFTAIIKLEAKKVGVAFNINGSSTITNIVFTTVTAGVDAVKRNRFKILHDVFFEKTYGSNSFELVFNGSAIPNEVNQAEFNITDVLRSLLELHIPVFSSIDFFLNNAAKRIYTRYAESFGFPTEISTANTTPVKLAILGGQNFIAAAQENFESNYIATPPQRFLTAMPQNTTVSKEQKQYLSFYVNAPIILRLYADIFYTDNTHEVKSIMYDEVGISGIYTFAIGYDQLNIDGLKNPAKTVSKYILTWWDTEADEIYSDSFVFEVDLMPQLFARHFLFFNSFGMPETICFTGKQSENTQLRSDLVRVANSQFDTENGIYQGEFTEINNELQFAYELNSGWKNKQWLNYFTDFLLSRKRFLQGPEKWIGLNIPAQKVSLMEDDKEQVAVKFNYQDSFIEKGIAN